MTPRKLRKKNSISFKFEYCRFSDFLCEYEAICKKVLWITALDGADWLKNQGSKISCHCLSKGTISGFFRQTVHRPGSPDSWTKEVSNKDSLYTNNNFTLQYGIMLIIFLIPIRKSHYACIWSTCASIAVLLNNLYVLFFIYVTVIFVNIR
jgi:hypothetical protein